MAEDDGVKTGDALPLESPPTKESSDTPGPGVKEPTDERGVPYKNRVAELQRKLDEATTRQRELEQTSSQYLNMLTEIQQAKPAPPVSTTPPKPDIQALIDEGRYGDAIQTGIQQGIQEAEQRLIGTWDKRATFSQANQKAETEARALYPELDNPQSDFYREVAQEFHQRKLSGYADHPYAVLDAANLVAARKARKGDGGVALGELSRVRGATQAVLETSNQGKPVEPPAFELTDEQKRLAARYGHSPKEAAEILGNFFGKG